MSLIASAWDHKAGSSLITSDKIWESPCMCKEGIKSQPSATPYQSLLIMVLYTML